MCVPEALQDLIIIIALIALLKTLSCQKFLVDLTQSCCSSGDEEFQSCWQGEDGAVPPCTSAGCVGWEKELLAFTIEPAVKKSN